MIEMQREKKKREKKKIYEEGTANDQKVVCKVETTFRWTILYDQLKLLPIRVNIKIIIEKCGELWHKATCMGHPMKHELTWNSLLD